MRGRLAALAGAMVLACLPASRAAAQDPASGPDYAGTGVYVSFAGVFALEDFDNTIKGFGPAPVSVENGLGFTGRVGWRFCRWAAAELSGEYIPFNANQNLASGNPPADFDGVAGMAQLKGILPLGRVEPFAIFGLGGFVIADADIDKDSGLALRGGVGAQFHVTEHFSVVVEGTYLGGTGDISDVGYGSLVWGLQYRF